MKLNPRQYELQFEEDDENVGLVKAGKNQNKSKKKPQKFRDEYSKRDNKKLNKPYKVSKFKD